MPKRFHNFVLRLKQRFHLQCSLWFQTLKNTLLSINRFICTCIRIWSYFVMQSVKVLRPVWSKELAYKSRNVVRWSWCSLLIRLNYYRNNITFPKSKTSSMTMSFSWAIYCIFNPLKWVVNGGKGQWCNVVYIFHCLIPDKS